MREAQEDTKPTAAVNGAQGSLQPAAGRPLSQAGTQRTHRRPGPGDLTTQGLPVGRKAFPAWEPRMDWATAGGLLIVFFVSVLIFGRPARPAGFSSLTRDQNLQPVRWKELSPSSLHRQEGPWQGLVINRCHYWAPNAVPHSDARRLKHTAEGLGVGSNSGSASPQMRGLGQLIHLHSPSSFPICEMRTKITPGV